MFSTLLMIMMESGIVVAEVGMRSVHSRRAAWRHDMDYNTRFLITLTFFFD